MIPDKKIIIIGFYFVKRISKRPITTKRIPIEVHYLKIGYFGQLAL